MPVLEALQQRNSHARLTEPGPDNTAVEQILRAGLRAPDHGRLRPWHFTVITGERRAKLGEIFEQSLLLRRPDALPSERDRALSAPLRAPLIVAGILKQKPNEKVPRIEQAGAVACALHGMLLATEALGFGGVWRTGLYARDPLVIQALGGDPGDEIIGFLYLGTAVGPSKPLPEANLAVDVSYF